MSGRYTGHVFGYKVSEKSPRGVITYHIHTATPIPPATTTDHPVGSAPQLRLDEDSDQTFGGMADIAMYAMTTGNFVTIEVLSGNANEIDTISVP